MPADPYELSKEELLGEFMNACARVGVSASGLAIDFSAEVHRERMNHLYGAVLARLDRVSPPAKPGSKVRPNKKEIRPKGDNWKINTSPRALPKTLTVKTVYYYGGKKWGYRFAEEVKGVTAWENGEYDQAGSRSWLVPLSFGAEDFDLVGEPSSVPA